MLSDVVVFLPSLVDLRQSHISSSARSLKLQVLSQLSVDTRSVRSATSTFIKFLLLSLLKMNSSQSGRTQQLKQMLQLQLVHSYHSTQQVLSRERTSIKKELLLASRILRYSIQTTSEESRSTTSVNLYRVPTNKKPLERVAFSLQFTL